MKTRIVPFGCRCLGVLISFVLLVLIGESSKVFGQITIVPGGPVTTESRQIKLVVKLASGAKNLVGASGAVQISGAPFRVGDVSRITVVDGSNGANLLTDIKAGDDGSETIKFGYFASQPLSEGQSLFQLVLIPTGTVIVAGSVIEIQMHGIRTTGDGFQFDSHADSRVTVPVLESKNTRPRFTVTSTAEFFRSRANQLQLVANDAESPASDLRYVLMGAPVGMSITASGLIRWTPGAEVPVGQGRFTAQVEDPEGGKDSQEILYTVREAQAFSLRVDQAWVVESSSTRFLQLSLVITDLPVPINGVQFKITYPPHLRLAGDDKAPRFLGDFAKTSVAALISPNTGTRTVSAVANSLDSVGARGQAIFQMTLIPDPSLDPGIDPQFLLSQIYQSSSGTLTPVTGMSVPISNLLGASPVFRGLAEAMVDEETELKLQLEATDADLPAQPLTFGLVSGPSGMTVTPEGALRWTPTELQGGQSFLVKVRVSDGVLDSVGTFSVVVRDVNWPPEGISQSLSVIQGNSLAILLGGKDRDGDSLKYSIAGVPTKGELSGTPPNLSYRPNPDQIGVDQFTFRANDGLANSALTTVLIQILPANAIPVAVPQTVTVDEDGTKSIKLAANDPEGSVLTLELVAAPSNGVLKGSPPTVIYQPNPNFSGRDSFQFRAFDGELFSAPATVAIDVSSVNDAPVIASVKDQVLESGRGLDLLLTASDVDLPAQSLAFSLKSGPSGMTVNASGRVVWVPRSTQRPGVHRVVVEVSDGLIATETSFSVEAKAPLLTAVINGVAIDGYIAGARVWFDGDLDGLWDTEEPSTTTDRSGNFNLDFDSSLFDRNGNGKLEPLEGRLIVEGGIDLASGQPRVGQLTAPPGSQVITPLTTMVDLVSRQGAGISTVAAEEKVRAALGLPAAVSLTTFDPIEAALRGDAQAAQVQVASASIADTISLVASVIDGASASVDARKASAAVTEIIAAKIAAASVIDLQSTALLQETVSKAAAAVSAVVPVEVKSAVSQVIAEQNTAKQKAVANSWNPLEALNAISQVQSVAQGPAASAASKLGAGTLATDELTLLYTGTALEKAIALAPVGDVTASNLQPGTFEFSGAQAVVAEGGKVVRPLSVVRKDGSYGSVQVIVRMSGTAGVFARDAITLDFADGVTQVPIDLASLPIEDALPHSDRLVTANVSLGSGFPAGAAIGGTRQSEIRVIDNDAVGSIGFTQLEYRGSEGKPVLVELERSNGSAGRILAQIRLSGGSAQSGLDYGSTTIPVTFEAGQSRAIANLGWLEDVLQESPETVNLTVELLPGSDPGAFLTSGQQAASVTVDDAILPSPTNQPPVALGVAEGDKLSVVEGQKIGLTLQGRDPEGAALTFVRVASPTKGVLSGKPPALIYTANLGQSGEDSFSFKVSDGQSDSAVLVVRIQVEIANLAPTALTQVLTTEASQSLPFRLSGLDPEGDSLTYRLISGPSNGAISGNPPDLVYTPKNGFSGLDQMEFVANDGRKDSKPQTIWIVVSKRNGVPVAQAQDLVMLEDDPMTVTLSGVDPEGSTLVYEVVDLPSHGKLTGVPPKLTFTPDPNFNGTDAIGFRVSDGAQFSAPARISLSIKPVNDAPVAMIQRLEFTNGVPLKITLSGTDVENDPLTFRIIAQPSRGTLTGAGALLVYNSPIGQRTEDFFIYQAEDGDSHSAPVRITLVPTTVNQPPTAKALDVQVLEDVETPIVLQGFDPEGGTLSYALVASPTNGTIRGTPPNLVYLSKTNSSGLDRFTYRVGDGEKTSEIVEVVVTVAAVNDPPYWEGAMERVIDATKPWEYQVSALDVDNSARDLVYTVLKGPSGLKIDAAGKLQWTPTSLQVGNQVVQISVSDGALSAQTQLLITVEPLNSPPQFPALALRRVSEGNLLSFNLVASDSDEPAQKLTFNLVNGPEGLSVSSNGVVSWRPSEAQGPSTNLVWLSVTDSGKPALSTTNSVQIVVREVNQAPILPDIERFQLDALKSSKIALLGKDLDLPVQPLTYRLLRGPQGSSLTTQGLLEWTPTLAQRGVHELQVSLTDGVSVVSKVFLLDVRVVNTPPSLLPVGTRRVAEGNLLSFSLNATDAEQAIQRLAFGLVRGPEGLTVSTNGLVSWKPTELQGPSTNSILVRVTDDGEPALSHTNSIEIIVREVNQAPTTVALAPRKVSEGNLVSFAITASDADQPAQRLSFSLMGAPDGVSVSTNGVLSWKPTESQGPSTNLIRIRISDDGSPSLSVTNSVEIVVREVNVPPQFAPLGPKAVRPGDELVFPLNASDLDLPVQNLTYRIVSGPTGLTVSTNGLIRWKPVASQRGVHSVVVSVSDGLVATQGGFSITVADLIAPRLELVIGGEQPRTLKVFGLAGFHHQIETSTTFGAAWRPMSDLGEVETLGYEKPVEVRVESMADDQMFYRIRPIQP